MQVSCRAQPFISMNSSFLWKACGHWRESDEKCGQEININSFNPWLFTERHIGTRDKKKWRRNKRNRKNALQEKYNESYENIHHSRENKVRRRTGGLTSGGHYTNSLSMTGVTASMLDAKVFPPMEKHRVSSSRFPVPRVPRRCDGWAVLLRAHSAPRPFRREVSLGHPCTFTLGFPRQGTASWTQSRAATS